MALPVFLIPGIKFLGPILPFFKIAAIGLIKLVFLFVGSLVAPVHTYMLLNIMTVPTVIKIIKHLTARDKLSSEQAKAAVVVLNEILMSAKSKDLNRTEARSILLNMQKDIIAGIKLSFVQSLRWIKNTPQRLRRWDARKSWEKTRQQTRDLIRPRKNKTDSASLTQDTKTQVDTEGDNS